MTGALTIRPAVAADLSAVQHLSVAAGQSGEWSGAEVRYLEHVLETGRMLVAAGTDGRLVGWGAIRHTPAGELLSDLFVHPDVQGRGVGAAVLGALWPDPDAGGRFTFSSRHENALPLYARAGLLPSWPLLYLTGERARSAGSAGPATAELRVQRVDVATATAVEAGLVGGQRAAEYAFWAVSGTPIVVEGDGVPVGAGVLGPHEVLHLVSADEQAVPAALAALGSELVSVCLPGPHPAVSRLLRSGFRITDYDIAMATPELRLATTWAYSPGLA